ncbi:hypothetical protein E2562_009631 [Oryza meyeriana var. granulata]|uniref:Uncharacterized protein n=1 Tax=Oryza meyeriana var. granulata TaxID=110450 RepID=A0A6G1BJD7_9ORYZ|nr:hypothetical protein E2562_009631 [Oryza meyeriana var. granulata]
MLRVEPAQARDLEVSRRQPNQRFTPLRGWPRLLGCPKLPAALGLADPEGLGGGVGRGGGEVRGDEGLDSRNRFPFPFRFAVLPLSPAYCSYQRLRWFAAASGAAIVDGIVFSPRDPQRPWASVSSPLHQPLGVEGREQHLDRPPLGVREECQLLERQPGEGGVIDKRGSP